MYVYACLAVFMHFWGEFSVVSKCGELFYCLKGKEEAIEYRVGIAGYVSFASVAIGEW